MESILRDFSSQLISYLDEIKNQYRLNQQNFVEIKENTFFPDGSHKFFFQIYSNNNNLELLPYLQSDLINFKNFLFQMAQNSINRYPSENLKILTVEVDIFQNAININIVFQKQNPSVLVNQKSASVPPVLYELNGNGVNSLNPLMTTSLPLALIYPLGFSANSSVDTINSSLNAGSKNGLSQEARDHLDGIDHFEPGTGKHKYAAVLKTGKKVQFGHIDYQQYRDSVPVEMGGGLYSDKDHYDEDRRERYKKRHGAQGYQKNLYSPSWFSWNFLW